MHEAIANCTECDGRGEESTARCLQTEKLCGYVARVSGTRRPEPEIMTSGLDGGQTRIPKQENHCARGLRFQAKLSEVGLHRL